MLQHFWADFLARLVVSHFGDLRNTTPSARADIFYLLAALLKASRGFFCIAKGAFA